ncbi:MAG: signal recognition particle protein [Spirochaetaceae bacterium]|jgi:signal recognition particle subunit SRP54|nr:signal recognition particle protein [Spirochaetaceae bacterium]
MLEKLTNKIQDAFKFVAGKSTITEKNISDAVDAIKMALLEADVNLRVVRRFVNSTIEEARGGRVLRSVNPGEQFVKIVHDKLTAFLGGDGTPPAGTVAGLKLKGPDAVSVILMLGLQGSGKTTSSAKLAARLKKQGRKPLLAACDLARPAAAEQLAVLAAQIETPVCRADAGAAADVCAVFRNALHFAETNGLDTIIVDTAGRLQIDEGLVAELVRLRDVAKPDELLLVADSMTGQSAADIAKTFDEKVGLTGVILTKFDSDTRGGAALSLKTVTGKALKFVGTGEKLADFEVFHPERFAGRILGMGDVVSLVEKAQEVIDRDEALNLQKKMAKETFSLEDYLRQIRAVKKMGNLKGMLDMMPGIAGKLTEDDLEKAELKTHEVIIQSMTKKERANHLIIGPSRRARIARGSGTSVGEVARLLKRFEKMRTMMKKVAKMGDNPAAMQKMFGMG